MSFADVKKVVSGGNLELLGRSVAQQIQYDEYRNNVLKVEWNSVSDLILCSRFGMEFTLLADNKKMARKPFTPEFQNPQTRLVRNDFPYYFEDDVLHYILWKINGEVDALDIEKAQGELRAKYEVIDMVYYINPPYLKSILDVEHAHLVVQIAEK